MACDLKLVWRRAPGLAIGERGGIRVNEHLQTSDPNIWAVGDAIEVRDAVTGSWSLVPLAGPANRQGRIAADNIFGRPSRYKGTWGTAILRLFDLTVGCTGANEKNLRKAGIPFQAIHLHPNSHAGYYPGAELIAMKVLFAPDTGKLLGTQVVGHDGVDKRLDVFATAIKGKMTMHDLAELELAYAPPFGSAKDPVNLAGMAAQNVLSGDVQLAQWNQIPAFDLIREAGLVLDVRTATRMNTTKARYPARFIFHLINFALARRIAQRPGIVVHCLSGQRSYFACRILSQHGFRVRNLTGSYRTWKTATSG